MATLQQRKNLIGNALLQDKIRVAAYDIATAVLQDPARANEHPFFQNVVNSPNSWDVMPLVWEVAQNPALQEKLITNPSAFSEDALDSDIIYVVTTSITKYSVPA